MKLSRTRVAILSALIAGAIFANPSVAQNPGVTPVPPITTGHCVVWTSATSVGDAGASCAAGGAVASVFTRTGAVVATLGDYSFSLISGNWTLAQGPTIAANTVLGETVSGIPVALAVPSCSATGSSLQWTSGTGFGCPTQVASAFGRTGAVVATANDYSFAQLSGSYTLAQGPSIAANTVLSNWTAGATVPAANTWPACANDGVHALVYINGTGLQCASITAGGFVNILNSVTANYTIQTTDCGKTIQAGTGATGLFTVTLPVVAGFSSTCVVNVTNSDTGRGKTLSGFPADTYCILYPLQSVMVAIVNGAWTTIQNPGLYAPTGNIAFHADSVNGHDTCASDGLATGAAAFATIPYAYRTWQQHFRGTNTAGQSVSVTVEDATLTIVTDIAILGIPAPGYISTASFKPFQILGKGPSSTTIQSSTASVNIFQGQGGAEFMIDQMTLKSTGAGAACVLVNNSNIQVSTASTGNVWFDKCANAGMDAAGYAMLAIRGPWTILTTATFGSVKIVESGAWGFDNGALTVSGTPSWTIGFVVADITARWDLSGFTVPTPGSPTGPKFNVTLNGVVFSPGIACASLPGSTAGSIATGGQCP